MQAAGWLENPNQPAYRLDVFIADIITVLYHSVVNRCRLNVRCILTVTVRLTYNPHVIC